MMAGDKQQDDSFQNNVLHDILISSESATDLIDRRFKEIELGYCWYERCFS